MTDPSSYICEPYCSFNYFNFDFLSSSLRVIEELTQEKHSLGLRVEELKVQVHNLSSSLKKKEWGTQVFVLPRLLICIFQTNLYQTIHTARTHVTPLKFHTT